MPRTMSVQHVSMHAYSSVRRGGDTIDVAEPGGLALLRMMQAASPVNSNITLPSIQPRRALHAPAGTDPTKLKQPVKHRTIVAHVVLALLLRKAVHIVRCHPLQEVDVFIGVELCHLVLGCRLGTVYLEFLVEAVVHDERMRHSDAVWLHWVAGVVGIIAHVRVVEVGHLAWLGGG